MKDAARLLAYLAATTLLGALGAPYLFWGAAWLARRGVLTFLQEYDFESFFHRALLVSAVALLWPLIKSLHIRGWRDLALERNQHARRDAYAGLVIAAGPLAFCAAVLINAGFYQVRRNIGFDAMPGVVAAAAVVPFIEETLFRGLILGVLLRSNSRVLAVVSTSALFSIIHFLKAPDETSPAGNVSWYSGFVSLANAFSQFREPLLVAGGFTTLFLIACILADARIATRSLWLPIGLHAGWIVSNGLFNKIARSNDMIPLPWLGKNLLVGIVPLTVAAVSWALLRGWLQHVRSRHT